MTAFIIGCLWIVAAQVIALLPSRDRHWRAAYVLIAVGLPILWFVYREQGPWVALLFLIGGMALLRWPVWYLFLNIRRLLTGARDDRDD